MRTWASTSSTVPAVATLSGTFTVALSGIGVTRSPVLKVCVTGPVPLTVIVAEPALSRGTVSVSEVVTAARAVRMPEVVPVATT